MLETFLKQFGFNKYQERAEREYIFLLGIE